MHKYLASTNTVLVPKHGTKRERERQRERERERQRKREERARDGRRHRHAKGAQCNRSVNIKLAASDSISQIANEIG